MKKRFDYTAKAWMGEYAFSIAGTIEIEKGQNGYVAARENIMSDGMYDRVEYVRKANFSKV